jgi:hypothetical protein
MAEVVNVIMDFMMIKKTILIVLNATKGVLLVKIIFLVKFVKDKIEI